MTHPSIQPKAPLQQHPKGWMKIASALFVGVLGGVMSFNTGAQAAPQMPPTQQTVRPFVRFLPNSTSALSPDRTIGNDADGRMTTMAVGESGSRPELQNPSDNVKITTMMVGEEGGNNEGLPPGISLPGSEEGPCPSHRPSDNPITTMAVGEEGGRSPQPLP